MIVADLPVSAQKQKIQEQNMEIRLIRKPKLLELLKNVNFTP